MINVSMMISRIVFAFFVVCVWSSVQAPADAVVLNRPYNIVAGTATVDGDLSEWVDVEWTPLTTLYDAPRYPGGAMLNPATPDIAEAYYAAKWTPDKVYMAIKVRDTAHKLIPGYVAWDAADLVEYVIHTTGTGPSDYNNYGFAAAQEYVVGIRPDKVSVWATLGPTGSVTGTNIDLAARVVGQWHYHEAGIIPYQVLNRNSPNYSVISYLSAGDIIGLDALALANDGVTRINTGNSLGYTGMRSENTMTGKFMNYNAIGRHTLIDGGTVARVKECANGVAVGCTGLVTAVYGSVFYMQATDRSSGIRVRKTGHGMLVGYAANVVGMAATDSTAGERFIDAASGTVTGAFRQTPAPIGANNRSLSMGAGLDSTGLYVRTTGRVATKGSNYFLIEDGSGVIIKVSGPAPTGTPYVVVTGVSTRYKHADGSIQRMIIAGVITPVAP